MEQFSPEKWAEKALQEIVKLADKMSGIDTESAEGFKSDRFEERALVKWNLW